jgi:hypothetical protein
MKTQLYLHIQLRNKFISSAVYVFLLLFSLLGSAIAQDANMEAAKSHLIINKKKLNLSEQDLEQMVVSSSYISPTTGWFHAYFNQTHQSVEVYNGLLNVALREGHLINIGNNFVNNIEIQVPANSVNPTLSAEDAVRKAAESVKLTASNIVFLNSESNVNGKIVKAIFKDTNLSDENIVVKLYWLPYDKQEGTKSIQKIVLSWSVSIQSKDNQNVWEVHVDANSGDILRTFDNVIKCDFGSPSHLATPHICKDETAIKSDNTNKLLLANSYRVFNYPLESPNHGSRTLVSSPYTTFVPTGTGPGSTNGWHHDGTNSFTDTRGNNVYAQEDTNADNAGGIRPNSSSLEFDYPYTLGLGTASANQNASITNLFYWNNLIHDVLWKFGFDEPSGNFQANNMSRGGIGNDFVYADAQDGSGTNNANFYTPTDGSNSRMQMYIWDRPTDYDADSDFDNGIIAHEYGHGWSIRLTGGPANSSCLNNAEQGGEGWSDYLSLMLTTDWSSLTPTVASANISRGIGTYALGQSTSGLGIRPYPYSYNMASVNSQVTYAGVGNSSVFSQPHGIGSIWATMLWDMTWEIILQDNQIVSNIYNTSNMVGNIAALKLVNEGLRLQPCSPSFVQARDAILAADQALFGGRYRCAIGRAFARRGLGANASTGTSTNDRIVTEDYTPIGGNGLSSLTTASVCTNTPFNYTATSSTTGTTFSWTRASVTGINNPASSGSSAVINETLINTTTQPIVVTYLFTLLPDPCGSNTTIPQPVRVTVNPAPIVPTVGSYTICQNGVVPNGEGLAMPSLNQSTSVNGALVNSDPTFIRPSGSSGTVYSAGSSSYYKTYTFVSSISGNVDFTITEGSYDTFLVLYQTSFNPSSPATNMLRFDDDSGVGTLSSLTHSLTQGSTYVLVVGSYGTLSTGTFKLQSSVAGFGSTYNWYTTATGSSPIATGSIFNPIGVTGSGIPNTASAITVNYYVADAQNPNCRTTTTFSVTPANISPTPSGVVNSSNSVCAILNSGTLTLTGHSGSIIGWESSTDNFVTRTAITNTSNTINFSKLSQTTQYRAILNRGTCSIAYPIPATITVISPTLNLSGLANGMANEVITHKATLSISSEQNINSPSKINYEAGRKIELNSGFTAASGTVFNAQIINSECVIPVVLTLQPNASSGKDTDISSLATTVSFSSNPYLAPYAWTQFGTQDIRRSLVQFDLSSIPNTAVIDSAYLSLYFSQKLIQDNPSFSGHFGTNILEIKRITQDWVANSTTWNNQPASTTINMITVPAASSTTQDYPNINVTNLVRDQVNNNFGFLIKHKNETPYLITCLTSSEETNALKRPKLVVYYHYN